MGEKNEFFRYLRSQQTAIWMIVTECRPEKVVIAEFRASVANNSSRETTSIFIVSNVFLKKEELSKVVFEMS